MMHCTGLPLCELCKVCVLTTAASRAKSWHQINAFEIRGVSAVVCSKAVVLKFLMHCLLLPPLFVGVRFLVLALLCCTKSRIVFFNYLAEEERAGCFTLAVFMLSCGY